MKFLIIRFFDLRLLPRLTATGEFGRGEGLERKFSQLLTTWKLGNSNVTCGVVTLQSAAVLT